jgi:putative intracellular protease/amidase
MNSVIIKALIVVTSHAQLGTTGKPTGWYLSEVSHVYAPLIEAGIQVDFASPLGGAAPMDPSSYKVEDKINKKFIDDPNGLARLKNTIHLKDINPEDYQIIFFAGGHGTMWDFANDENLKKIAVKIYENQGIIAAVCHGPAALVNLKLSNGKYLVEGKKLTAFSNTEEEAVGLTSIVPFSLETSLVNRGSKYSKADVWQKSVVTDERLVTGQNPASAEGVGHAIIEVLNLNIKLSNK